MNVPPRSEPFNKLRLHALGNSVVPACSRVAAHLVRAGLQGDSWEDVLLGLGMHLGALGP